MRGRDSISGRFAPVRREARASTTGTAVRDDATPVSNHLKDTQNRWPSDRIRTVVQLTDAQHDALKKLQAAINQSDESIMASCANSRGTAPERLNALVSTLWAVRDAGNAIRGPLQEFYDTLTPAQKQSFATRQPQASAPRANLQSRLALWKVARKPSAGSRKSKCACGRPKIRLQASRNCTRPQTTWPSW